MWNLPKGTPWASEPTIMFNTNIFFPGIKYGTSQMALLERASHQSGLYKYLLSWYKVWNLPNGPPWASERANFSIMKSRFYIFFSVKSPKWHALSERAGNLFFPYWNQDSTISQGFKSISFIKLYHNIKTKHTISSLQININFKFILIYQIQNIQYTILRTNILLVNSILFSLFCIKW